MLRPMPPRLAPHRRAPTRLLSATLLLVGCASAPPATHGDRIIERPALTSSPPAEPPASPGTPGAKPYTIHPGVDVTEDWVDCRTEDDCAIVEVGCCDHCNGGAITAVNRAYAERARELIARATCGGRCSGPACTGCTKKACDAATSHELVCMTRACHIVDLEDEVQERIWGAPSPDGDAAVEGNVIESAP